MTAGGWNAQLTVYGKIWSSNFLIETPRNRQPGTTKRYLIYQVEWGDKHTLKYIILAGRGLYSSFVLWVLRAASNRDVTALVPVPARNESKRRFDLMLRAAANWRSAVW